MFRFFENRNFNGDTSLNSENLHHLKDVIRIEDKEEFQVVFNDGIFAFEMQDGKIIKKHEISNSNESSVRLTLFFGILKGSKNEDVLKHATEIGVTDFYPVFMDRSIADFSKKMDKKQIRFQKIVESAAKQSKRDIVPIVHAMIKSEDIINFDGDLVICYEDEKKTQLGEIINNLSNNIGLIVGPEGGLSDREIKILKNAYRVGLGKRILRAETASIVASFYIIHGKECLDG